MNGLHAPDWHESAACRKHPTELFFPASPGSKLTKRAKDICKTCPVRKPCLEFALHMREPYGIWGGLTEEERDDLLISRRTA